MNKQHVTILVLLDLSAAFDTVDHSILLNRLSSKLGWNGTALAWFRSYLSGRSQRVSVRGTVSDKFDLRYGVPQGSCLGPLLFTVYASALFDVVEKHLPTVHCYADYTSRLVPRRTLARLMQLLLLNIVNNCVAEWRWVPGMSSGFHLWHGQPLDRVTPPWLANPSPPAMSPHANGTRHLSH